MQAGFTPDEIKALEEQGAFAVWVPMLVCM
jgi:hypothetical protein